MKEDEGTLAAQLRNVLGPHYGLPSVILKLRKHPEILKIVEEMAEQAIKNNLVVDTLLKQIDDICDYKAALESKIVYVGISVKDRLPEKPIRPRGGQQVNIVRFDYGIEKVVLFVGHDVPAIAGFHYENRRWYLGWDCRSGIVDEEKYMDVTASTTHWLEPITNSIK